MLQLPASFLSVIKEADTFVGEPPLFLGSDGSYTYPYRDLAEAIARTPPGGTIVLNGGWFGVITEFHAETITANVTLSALPDKPVTISK